MNKNNILDTIKKARENSKKRKFNQTFDLVINLKNLNLKKPEENVNTFIMLPYGRGKKTKVCALVGQDLVNKAKEVCDKVILKDEFAKLDKKDIKLLAREYDFFIAQVNLMPDIAKYFGKILGTRGKMPNPKAGCVVPVNAELKPLYEKLQKTIKVETKNESILKLAIGNESMKDDDIAENILNFYNTILGLLPQDKNNIKNIFLKLTMGKPILIGDENV
ncbi:MAG: 50S ribosomal protein L1 [Candidatus Woesearchaeota archaeon]